MGYYRSTVLRRRDEPWYPDPCEDNHIYGSITSMPKTATTFRSYLNRSASAMIATTSSAGTSLVLWFWPARTRAAPRRRRILDSNPRAIRRRVEAYREWCWPRIDRARLRSVPIALKLTPRINQMSKAPSRPRHGGRAMGTPRKRNRRNCSIRMGGGGVGGAEVYTPDSPSTPTRSSGPINRLPWRNPASRHTIFFYLRRQRRVRRGQARNGARSTKAILHGLPRRDPRRKPKLMTHSGTPPRTTTNLPTPPGGPWASRTPFRNRSKATTTTPTSRHLRSLWWILVAGRHQAIGEVRSHTTTPPTS